MGRHRRPFGLAILGVLLAGAAAAAGGPCPDDEHAKIQTLPGNPTAYQRPWLNEPDLAREAWIRRRGEDRTDNYDLVSPDDLKKLRKHIADLQKDPKPITKAQQRALAEALRLADRAIALHDAGQASSPEMGPVLTHLHIAAEAYGYEFIVPIPAQTTLDKVAHLFDGNVATGRTAARNPVPRDSPFWADPGKIAAKDLHKPANGKAIDLSKVICTFDEAKTGYGTKGGFDIDCGKAGDFKLKFGPESRSEPFNTRIYNALGFNVPTVEYTPGVTLKYDRRIFSQFNCRKEIDAHVAWAGMNIAKFPVSRYINPFRFIRSARLKNGKELTMAGLYFQMFGVHPPMWSDKTIDDPDQDRPELDDKRYIAGEAEIDTITTFEGSLEVKDKAADSIGNWNWNSPVYRDLREVRAAAVVSMWLGNYDVRWDNNKVKLVKDDKGNQRLVMFISDIGAGLGNPKNILSRGNDQPNEFPWTFTAGPDDLPAYSGGQNRVAAQINTYGMAVVDFLPDWENQTMQAVTREDALWTANLIVQLTEDQIKSALIAANFQSAEVFLLTQKLLNRREHLLRDSGGKDSTVRRLESHHSHDPRPGRHRPMSAKLPDGQVVTARTENEKIGREKPVKLLVRNGKVEEYD
ncbi:MAG TPA: hypothetical protein VEC60_07525 [Reyranella sp.]|nr:hypothetical protein [Reyranella sp.]